MTKYVSDGAPHHLHVYSVMSPVSSSCSPPPALSTPASSPSTPTTVPPAPSSSPLLLLLIYLLLFLLEKPIIFASSDVSCFPTTPLSVTLLAGKIMRWFLALWFTSFLASCFMVASFFPLLVEWSHDPAGWTLQEQRTTSVSLSSYLLKSHF